MPDTLDMIFDRLLKKVQFQHRRGLYERFNLNDRLTGLVGPRGVGKTTLQIQYIQQYYPTKERVYYFSADHIYFKNRRIYDFVEELYLTRGINTFFIDEIHKYGEDWSQELKNLYDGFPDIKIVFSGSSSLDLIKGGYDLSRRAKMYYLPGMSFREYLNFKLNLNLPVCDFEELMQNPSALGEELAEIPGVLGLYHDYLQQGFYPFLDEEPLSYYEKLLRVVDKTIHEDIANFYNLKTANLRYFSKLLNHLASIPPGKVSTYNLGKNLGIDNKTVSSYLIMLQETGLVEIIYPADGGNKGLRKPEKVFFNNTNLHYALSKDIVNTVDVGTVRELAFVQSVKNAGIDVYNSSQGDYRVGDYIYEIGGKNKTRQQIKNLKSAFIVKDGTLAATPGMIPLIYFGFLY